MAWFAAAIKAEENEEAELWGGGEYHCAAAYPSPPCSMQLGRQNLHLFRLKNTRFDVIGGIFYFCLVVSNLVTVCMQLMMPLVQSWTVLFGITCS